MTVPTTGIRLLAILNGIDEKESAAQFDPATGALLAAAPGAHRGQWAADRQLVDVDPEEACFHNLAGRARHTHMLGAHCAFNGPSLVLDHARAYERVARTGRRQLAAVTFAPYGEWDDTRLHLEAHRFAAIYDLDVRIGMAADAFHVRGTVPIVFWNPRVIDLRS